MTHSKNDSEVPSLAPSSPEHNRRAAYFVQSPSRDSHDGEKTATLTSFLSTPALYSPMGSPQHYSSATRFSTKISPNDEGIMEGGEIKDKGNEDWNECNLIEEESLLENEESRKGLPLGYYFLAFVVGFFVLFSLFALILWGASKPQKPRISIKSIKFEKFMVHAGSDATGVSTDMISINATVKMSFRNRAKFFGVHVLPTPVDLFYSQFNIGSGNMKKFHQSRNGARNLSIVLIGEQIPMYGSAGGLSTPMGLTTLPFPMKLDFTVRSKAYVLGRLVTPSFNNEIQCLIVFEAKKLNVTIPLKNNCTYAG